MIEILMFTGPSCQACEAMKPIVKELPNAKIVDVTANYTLTGKYGIRGGLPVFVKLVDGDYHSRIDGVRTKNTFIKWTKEI